MSSKFQDDMLSFLDESRSLEPIPDSIKAAVVEQGSGEKHSIDVNRFVIGRGNCDLTLKDTKISERHATIGYFDGFFFLLDLGSKNSTYVNDKQVIETVLKDGDTICVGETTLRFEVTGDVETSVSVLDRDTQPNVAEILDVMFGDQRNSVDDTTRIMIMDSPFLAETTPLVEIKLSLMKKNLVAKEFCFVQSEILIGRDNGDLPLQDPDASKRHAMIEVFGEGQIYIKDLDSTNGTFVNSRRVRRTKIESGDAIQLGSSMFLISFGKLIENESQPDETPPTLCLRVVSGSILSKLFQLSPGEHTLGLEKSDINLMDHVLADPHAKLTVKEGRYELQDVGGKGTFVNGVAVQNCIVESGDMIRLGHTELKIESLEDTDKTLEAVIKDAGHHLD